MVKFGRAACIKLDSILDAMAIITKDVEITLPLCTGSNDEPLIYPSRFLTHFLENYNPQTMNLPI